MKVVAPIVPTKLSVVSILPPATLHCVTISALVVDGCLYWTHTDMQGHFIQFQGAALLQTQSVAFTPSLTHTFWWLYTPTLFPIHQAYLGKPSKPEHGKTWEKFPTVQRRLGIFPKFTMLEF